MIGRILGSGQLGKLASFVSPAFFDVMPAKALWSRARGLFAQSRNQEAFRHVVAERAADLQVGLPSIEVVTRSDEAPRPTPGGASADPDSRAAQVTELYFRQLFHGPTTLLDLRATAFTAAQDRLIWHPAPWQTAWAPEFIEPLRDLYRGFYGRDDATFRRGLTALSLSHSEDLFRAQFGGDQAQVSFRTADFVNTFHQVFMRCKQAGTSLHADFLPLGIYLAALYDHLETLAVPVNVALAFERATGAPARTQESLHA